MAKKRWKHNLPLSEWTPKELQESIDVVEALRKKLSSYGCPMKNLSYLDKLIIEKSSRIGQKKNV